jgi:hypothetical protein
MRQGWIVVAVALVAAGVGGCDGNSRTSEPCYPAFPSVAPASAPAASMVTVSSKGFSSLCEDPRTRKYELWIGTDAIAAFEHRGERVATVRVDRTGRISTPVRIPTTTAPGPHTITIGRLRRDHEEHGCDGGASCGIQPSNLTVTGPP